MGNRAQITIPSGIDINCDVLVAVFSVGNKTNVDPNSPEFGDGSGNYGEDFTYECRIAEKVVLQAGQQPSYAMITIAMTQFGEGHWDESAFKTALVNSGPSGKMNMNVRSAIYARTSTGQRVPVLNGTVVAYQHGIGNDSLVITVLDDRWLLTKVICLGQAQYDPQHKRYGLVTNADCVFNPFGFPNCIDTDFGPRFSPTIKYGWASSRSAAGALIETIEEPEPGEATVKARSWRVVDAEQYLHDMHYLGAKNGRPVSQGAYGKQTLGKGVVWPSGLGERLTSTGATRVLRNFSVQGLTLDLALTKLIQRAGPYELYCRPGKSDGGDDENDVGAFLEENDPSGVYQTLKSAFDTNMQGLAEAFDTGYSTFASVFAAWTSTMTAAMETFQGGIAAPEAYTSSVSKVLEAQTYLNNQLALIPAADLADRAAFKAAAIAYMLEFCAQIGVAVAGDPNAFFGDGNLELIEDDVANPPALNVERFEGFASSFKDLAMGAPRGNLSTLEYLDMRGPRKGDGFIVPALYNYDIHDAMAEACVDGGFVKESIENFFHDVCIVGDAPVYESVFSMLDSDTDGGDFLEPAWSDADQEAFTDYITDNGNNEEAFKEACQLWPLVFAAYRVSKNYISRFAGTKHANTIANWAHPKIRPTLVTGYQQNQKHNADGDNTDNPRNWVPRPIVIEYQTGDSPVTWAAGGIYDNLQVSQDGQYFTLTALRDSGSGITWKGDPAEATYDGAYMEPVNIRATLAIELDWRISGLSPTGEDADPNKTTGRVAGGTDNGSENRYTYTAIAEPDDYVDLLRFESHPVGQLLSANFRDFPDHATAGDELYTDTGTTGRLNQHAKARLHDVRRVEGGGVLTFPQFVPALTPGVGLPEVIKGDGVAGGVVKISGVIKRVVLEQNSQKMSVELATAADMGV